MSQKRENLGFDCENCGERVEPVSNGSYRNHCPRCLYSKHVDLRPGDRRSDCRGLMKPVDLVHRSGKGYQLVHQCLTCGERKANKVAVDTVQPDDLIGWLQLVQRG